jgi:Fe-S-cluster-containing dehydrogenase component
MSPLKSDKKSPPWAGESVARRTFLKALGVGTAMALAGCQKLPIEYALPFAQGPEEIRPGISTYYASTCTACPAACGLMVTVRDGRPIKLEGHPDHPLSKGGLCAIGQAHIRELYHSARHMEPTVGGKSATWAHVDEAVAAGIAKLEARKLAIVSPPITSPTARHLLQSFATESGGVLVEFDANPGATSAELEAWQLVAGLPLAPSLRFGATDVLLSLGYDFLGSGPNMVVHTAAYAERRSMSDTKARPPLRHIQVEGALSLSGAAADDRRAVAARERRLLALYLLKNLSGKDAELAAALGAFPAPENKATADGWLTLLKQNRGKSLVLTGSDDLGEQVTVALINRQLGNLGKTLDVQRNSLVQRALDGPLLELESELLAGNIGALFIMPGVDPVRQLPNGAAWAEAIAQLPLSVSLSDHKTTTEESCTIQAAAHHGLEMWGDALPKADVLTVVQPTIRPLFNTRHPLESMGIWGSLIGEGDYLGYLKKFWRENVFPGSLDFEKQWNLSVSSGRAAAGAKSPNTVPEAQDVDQAALLLAVTEGIPATSPELEVALLAEVSTGDGSHAHNAWLRELPDPLTRVAWIPVVRVAPSLAKSLVVEDGDVVDIKVAEAAVSMAVRVTPGMAPNVLGVPVGYPRDNGYALGQVSGGRIRNSGLAATVTKTGTKEVIPAFQSHLSSEGRAIIHELSSYDEHPDHPHHVDADLWKTLGNPETRWEMVLDLDACTGCGACAVACQAENNIPVVGPAEVANRRDMHWLRIDRYFDGDETNPDVKMEPMFCQQCGHAPCETVCPVLATVHSKDGLNQQIYNRCVGTRYCANNCPYKMRRFNWFEYDFGEELDQMVLNPDVVVRDRGVMEKCTFCVQRIQAARIAAKDAGQKGSFDVKPACQQSCPARAITFGNGADPNTDVSKRRSNSRAFQVLSELGIHPSVTYLARVRTRDGGES